MSSADDEKDLLLVWLAESAGLVLRKESSFAIDVKVAGINLDLFVTGRSSGMIHHRISRIKKRTRYVVPDECKHYDGQIRYRVLSLRQQTITGLCERMRVSNCLFAFWNPI